MKKFLSIFLTAITIISIIPISYYGFASNFGTAVYCGSADNWSNVRGVTINVKTVNTKEQKFTGTISIDGKHQLNNAPISGSVTGEFDGEELITKLSFSFNFHCDISMKLEINNEKGEGKCTASGSLMMPNTVVFSVSGTKKYKPFEYFESIYEPNNVIYDKTVWYNSIVYKDTFNNNTENRVPKLLDNQLKLDKYQDVEGYNFRNNIDNDCSYVLANKKLSNGKIKVLVVIRGTDGPEWEGNMKISGLSYYKEPVDVHQNFLQAEKSLKTELNNYIANLGVSTENIVILATGHSRGGAVSNLLVHDYSTDSLFKGQIFGYTFATPNVAKYTTNMESYGNIYNFCINNDFIPCIPLTNNYWNYWKYGKSYSTSKNLIPYCNDITNVMSSAEMAPNVKEYYKSKFTLSTGTHRNISLYDYMNSVLAKPMKRIDINMPSKGLILLGTSYFLKCYYKGLKDVSDILNTNLLNIAFYHMPVLYLSKSLQEYYLFTYDDALSRCNNQNNSTTNKVSNTYNRMMARSNSNDIIALQEFLNQKDANNVANFEKLGWNVKIPATWNGIIIDSNGCVTDINLPFKDLYGSINLDNFNNLKYLDISANYINNISLNGCNNLQYLDVSDNDITNINIDSCTSLVDFNCSYNNLSVIDCNDNLQFKMLDSFKCNNCNLNELSIIFKFPNLTKLDCNSNKLDVVDLSRNPKLTELNCICNYLDIEINSNQMNMINQIAQRSNSIVNYEPQYPNPNGTFNTNEINVLKLFNGINNNLGWFNGDAINYDKIFENVYFEKINGIYRVVCIDIDNLQLNGDLNLSDFTELKELFCSNNNLVSLNLKNCNKLELVDFEKNNIKSLELPTSYQSVSLFNCEYNMIDINIFSEDFINSIISKENSELNYKHQLVDESISIFNKNDSDLIKSVNNSNNLGWDTNKIGHIDEVNWIKDVETGEYCLYECNFNSLSIKGDIDFSKCKKLSNIDLSETDINTVSLPAVDINDGAFYNCKNLESVVLSNGTSRIGKVAFAYCDNLRAIYIPNTVVTIGLDVFYKCPNISVAGVQGSFAQTWATENNIPFKAGYFICGNVAVRENCETDNIYNYPLQYAEVKIDNNVVATTDENGYYVIFELGNGKLNYDIDYIYGWTVRLQSEIIDSSMIVTNPVSMVTFDMDQNGILNTIDIAMFTHYQQSIPTENHKYLDMNNDGVIDDKDAQIFDGLFMYKEPPTITSLPMQSMSAFRIAPQSVYEHKGIDVLPPIIE